MPYAVIGARRAVRRSAVRCSSFGASRATSDYDTGSRSATWNNARLPDARAEHHRPARQRRHQEDARLRRLRRRRRGDRHRGRARLHQPPAGLPDPRRGLPAREYKRPPRSRSPRSSRPIVRRRYRSRGTSDADMASILVSSPRGSSRAAAPAARRARSDPCKTGIICPSGTQCAAVQAVCITNDCGDGIVQTTGEAATTATSSTATAARATASRARSAATASSTRAGELCDDGNTIGGDGCSADCTSVEICGNGIKDVSEVCDDGNTDRAAMAARRTASRPRSAATASWTATVKRDVRRRQHERGDSCNSDCRSGPGCGNGIVDPGEECDDGNTDNNDDCLNICKRGTVRRRRAGHHWHAQGGLRCRRHGARRDRGLQHRLHGASCGDGKINKAALEQCDNGGSSDVATATATARSRSAAMGSPTPSRARTATRFDRDSCAIATAPRRAAAMASSTTSSRRSGAPGPEQCDHHRWATGARRCVSSRSAATTTSSRARTATTATRQPSMLCAAPAGSRSAATRSRTQARTATTATATTPTAASHHVQVRAVW